MLTNCPFEWQSTTLGQVARVRRGASPRPIDSPEWFADEGFGWVRIIDVTRSNGRLRTTEQRLSPRGVLRSVQVKPGQLIMSICATIGEPAVVEINVCIHDGFVVFEQYEKDLDTQFLYQFLRYWTPQFRAIGQTGRQANLNTSIVKATPLLLPPLPEQQRIADILDTIDEAIARTESLIAKLKQMKAGLLHDLLTRGLDENGQLRDAIAHPEHFKDSLLGRIPKEWVVEQFGEHIAHLDSGWSPICNSEPAANGEWGVLKTTAVVWSGYNSLENKKLPSNLQPRYQAVVEADDILITRKGPRERVGVVVHIPSTPPHLMIPDTVFRVRLKEASKLLPAFMPLALGSEVLQRNWNRKKIGLAEAQVDINYGIVRETLIHRPTKPEQEQIVKVFDIYNNRIRIEEAYRDKLKLQKKGLMHDLLTGKVRLNGAEKCTSVEDTVQLAVSTRV